jgi:SAM-dependent methyltransferase
MADPQSYVMGQTDAERQRLIQQSAYLEPLTETILRESGLVEGMSVLDLGCGTGGSSHVAARIVGPKGRVVGLDRDEATLRVARDFAAGVGLPQITFVGGTPDSVRFPDKFDAVMGRFVLIHQPEPLAVVRQALSFVRSGGIVAFLEPDFSPRPLSWPRVAPYEQMCGHVHSLFLRAGLPHDMGMRLRRTLHEAGVRDPQLKIDTIVGGGPLPLQMGVIHDGLAGAKTRNARHRDKRRAGSAYVGGALRCSIACRVRRRTGPGSACGMAARP